MKLKPIPPLKARYGMSSDEAGDWRVKLYASMLIIAPLVGTFHSDWMNLLAFCMFCIAQIGINYFHVGSGINAADFSKEEPTDDDELLRWGRR